LPAFCSCHFRVARAQHHPKGRGEREKEISSSLFLYLSSSPASTSIPSVNQVLRLYHGKEAVAAGGRGREKRWELFPGVYMEIFECTCNFQCNSSS